MTKLYKYAQIIYGKVYGIFEYPWTTEEMSFVFAPSELFIPIDNLEIKPEVGWGYNLFTNNFVEPEKPPEATFEDLKQQKLLQIAAWTKQAITSGFESNVKNEIRIYDSTDEDQATLNAMYNASRSPDFANHPVYKGQIPIRSYPKNKTSADKTIAGYNAIETQKLVDDQALHIGACKQKGWKLQSLVASAVNKTELEKIEW